MINHAAMLISSQLCKIRFHSCTHSFYNKHTLIKLQRIAKNVLTRHEVNDSICNSDVAKKSAPETKKGFLRGRKTVKNCSHTRWNKW